MADRGTSDGHRPSLCGRGCGVCGRVQPAINSPTSTIHISTSESTIPIVQQGTLLTVQEEPQPTFVGGIVDQRPFLQAIDKEYKFDEPWPTWKKIRLLVHDMWFEELKGSHIFKNAMNKIRNGHDHATWILPNAIEFQRLPSVWEVKYQQRR
ncbi:hypothetical protein CR513_04537, partial [Mucuna pruriens]